MEWSTGLDEDAADSSETHKERSMRRVGEEEFFSTSSSSSLIFNSQFYRQYNESKNSYMNYYCSACLVILLCAIIILQKVYQFFTGESSNRKLQKFQRSSFFSFIFCALECPETSALPQQQQATKCAAVGAETSVLCCGGRKKGFEEVTLQQQTKEIPTTEDSTANRGVEGAWVALRSTTSSLSPTGEQGLFNGAQTHWQKDPVTRYSSVTTAFSTIFPKSLSSNSQSFLRHLYIHKNTFKTAGIQGLFDKETPQQEQKNDQIKVKDPNLIAYPCYSQKDTQTSLERSGGEASTPSGEPVATKTTDWETFVGRKKVSVFPPLPPILILVNTLHRMMKTCALVLLSSNKKLNNNDNMFSDFMMILKVATTTTSNIVASSSLLSITKPFVIAT